MPDIKHNFKRGKMNKDLDERLVPNGEYRHAMNVQVSTSDGSAIGTVQNLLPNTLGCFNNIVPEGFSTVGSVSDEKNDALYWFAASQEFPASQLNHTQLINSIGVGLSSAITSLYDMTQTNPGYTADIFSFKDMIMRKKGAICEPVLVDTFGFIALMPPSAMSGYFLNNVPAEIFNLVDIGWNVTSVNEDGTHGNTSTVINTANLGVLDGYFGFDPGFQTYGGAFNTGTISLGMGPNFTLPGANATFFLINSTLFLNTNNLSNTFSGTPPVGASISIPGVTQAGTTIIAKENVGILNSQGGGTQTVKITLSQPFATSFTSAWVSPISYPPNYNESWLVTSNPPGVLAITKVDNNGDGLTGSCIFDAATANGTLNGDLIFQDQHFNVLGNLTAGDTIEPSNAYPDLGNGTGGVISLSSASFDPYPYVMGQGGSITIQIKDNSGNVIVPFNPNTWNQSTTIVISGTDGGSIIFDNPLETSVGTTMYDALIFDTGADRVLGFSKNNHITGINVLDDMLLWTDGLTEPNKINITRSIEGTDDSGNIHTRLVNKAMNYGLGVPYDEVPLKREHITVIKKGPSTQLSVKVDTGRSPSKMYSGIVQTALDPSTNTLGLNYSSIIGSTNDATICDFSAVKPGERIKLKINMDYNQGTDFQLEWKEGDEVVLKEFSSPNTGKPETPIKNYVIKAVISEWVDTSFVADSGLQDPSVMANDWPNSQPGTAHVLIEVLTVQGTPVEPNLLGMVTQNFAIDRFDNDDKLFEIKFPRFSYRYKFEDGEYSTLAPFTQVVFKPGTFDYHPTKGYNTGMVNTIQKIILGNFVADDIPKDVVEIDILYKEDSSPNIYIVDTVAPDDEPIIISNQKGSEGVKKTHWYLNEYIVENDIINGSIASNQLVRVWDNVPKTAKAQEISGNRIIYGNYEQNIDLKVGGNNYKPQFKHYVSNWQASDNTGSGPDGSQPSSNIKSIKSLREYQMGVVFTDKYGRETPVLSNSSGIIKLNQTYATSRNRLKVGMRAAAPDDAEFFKFYIKESSGEYYNLAMDRWYDAEDGNIWLAFPSTERNKIKDDTYIILKKGQNKNATQSTLKFGVVAVEGNAPDYIKTVKLGLGRRTHNPQEATTTGDLDTGRLFGTSDDETNNIPRVKSAKFNLHWRGSGFGNSTLSNLDEITDGVLYCRFDDGKDQSARYRISELTSDRNTGVDGLLTNHAPFFYHLILDKPLGDEVNFIYDNPNDISKIRESVSISFWKYKTENKPQFDGRFFVKIFNDGSIKQTITDATVDVNYERLGSKMVYLLDSSKMQNIHRSSAVNGIGNLLDDAAPEDTDGQGESGRATWQHMSARTSFFSKLKSGQHTPDGGGNAYHGFYDMQLGDVDSVACGTAPCNKYTTGKPYTPVSGLETDFKGVWFINKQLNRGSQWSNGLYAPYAENEDVEGGIHEGTWRYIDAIGGWNRDGGSGGTPAGYGTQSQGIKNYSHKDTTVMNLGFGGIEAPGGLDNTSKSLAVGIGGYRYDSIGLIEKYRPKRNSDGRVWDITDYDAWADTQGSSASPIISYALGRNSIAPANVEGFFGIGTGATHSGLAEVVNSNYRTQSSFSKEINSGSLFQWEEDPYETKYSFIGGYDFNQYLRFHEGDSGYYTKHGMSRQDALFMASPANYTKNWSFEVAPKMDVWNPTANYGSHIENGLKLGVLNYPVSVETFNNVSTIVVTSEVPTNHFKAGMSITGSNIPNGTMIISVTISSTGATTAIMDKAATANQTITARCGFVCTVIEDLGSTDAANLENFHIRVNSIQLECSIQHKYYVLKPGMLLKAYNIALDETLPSIANSVFPSTYDADGNVIAQNLSNLLIKEIEKDETDGLITYKIRFTGFTKDFTNNTVLPADFNNGTSPAPLAFTPNKKLLFMQASMNSASEFSEANGDESRQYLSTPNGGIGAVGYKMQFVKKIETYEDGGFLPEDPFVWETESNEVADLDIYYEASGKNPIVLNGDNIATVFPIGSTIKSASTTFTAIIISNNSENGDEIELDTPDLISFTDVNDADYQENMGVQPEDILIVTRPDGTSISVQIAGDWFYDEDFPKTIKIEKYLFNGNYHLNWFNCYSFGNGVESNRVRDAFNLPFIENGVRVSSTVDEPYKAEHRKYGLIYSGIYNSTSGVNNLNQFSMAEKITKDLNPTYGSIQKLHSRSTADGDLIALCEDRILKILANKDALFNADGNPQLIASNKVLGNATPFSGQYGISTNPESFASYSYRVYFADKVRGAVLRLSKDGLTAISENGMKDWFRDNLRVSSDIIGSHDDRQEEYNITLKKTHAHDSTTVTFKENVKGWSSFKSFIPDNGISCANQYYTFENARLWAHDAEQGGPFGAVGSQRNVFYDKFEPSSVSVILNNAPSIIKSFKTLNYEGSQAKVTVNLGDDQYHNLFNKEGWFVDSVITNKEKGSLSEFIEKEGKWFNYIKGDKVQHSPNTLQISKDNDGRSTFDQASFAIQGLGVLLQSPNYTSVSGCTNPAAFNYDPNAVINVGCIPFVYGCMVNGAGNYDSLANDDDGTCLWFGCNDTTAYNYLGLFPAEAYTYVNSSIGAPAIMEIPACVAVVNGCTDALATNPDPNANTDDGSCIYSAYGCTISHADNYYAPANTDDGTCTWYGCWLLGDPNYHASLNSTQWVEAQSYNAYGGAQYGLQDDGSCVGGGCTYGPSATEYYWDDVIVGGPNDGVTWGTLYNVPDPGTGMNFYPAAGPQGTYDSTASYEDGSCIWLTGCTDPIADNYDANFGINDGTCVYSGCIDVTALNYDSNANNDDGSCEYPGCPDSSACNYNSNPNIIDDGSCDFILCAGCMSASTLSGDGVTTIFSNNYNTQTDQGVYDWCMDPTNTIVIPCTIPCGDGTDATDQGDGCCEYVQYGCTDNNFCNFDPYATYGDFMCSNDSCTGCMDPNYSLYNTNINSGLPQVNTHDCVGNAGGSDVSCCGTNIVNGCMDPNACNYDSNANTDPFNDLYVGAHGGQTSCIYKIDSVSIVAGTNPGLNIPAVTNMEIIDDIYFDATNYSLDYPTWLYFNPTGAGTPGSWPVGGTGNTGAGNYQYYNQTSVPAANVDNSMRLLIEKKDLFNNTWSDVSLISDKREANQTNLSDQLLYGFPFGNVLDVYSNSPQGNVPTQYRYTVYSELWKSQYVDSSTGPNINVLPTDYGLYKFGGTPAGTTHTHHSPQCGASADFSFIIVPCDASNSTMGCTDGTACNYDASATCSDGSCFYGSIPFYGGPSCNVVSGCSAGPNIFTTLDACCTAYSGGSNCPQD